MPKKHYVAMAGLHGYMPNYSATHDTKGSAAADLASIHSLSGRAEKRLRRDMYLELDLAEFGNEYCEIAECECGDIGTHSDLDY